MKTLKKLAEEIEQSPNEYQELLSSFRTTNSELRNFLSSMRTMHRDNVSIIPSLIKVFGKHLKEYDPETLGDLAEVAKPGTMFATLDGGDYSLIGKVDGGMIQIKENNTGHIEELPGQTRIKWVF